MTAARITSIERALAHIKRDVTDDFWPDIISYDDYFSANIFTEKYFKDYTPESIISLNIPKPTLILRPGHFIRFTDRIYFQKLINEFAKQVDKKILGRDIVFSNRLSSHNSYFFEKSIEAWKRFNKKSDDLFKECPEGFLLKTDISAYFEHIIIKKLIEIILNLGAKQTTTNKLSFLLNTWHESGIGIPQGNYISSFLGNIYLHEVDDAMINSGFNYYRYADDIRVFAKDEKTIREALAKITELFRPLNLHLSGGKTKILNKSDHLSAANKYAKEMDAINYSIDINVNKLTENIPKLKKIWKTGLKNKDKTLINFCIYRFKKLNLDYPLNIILRRKLLDPSFTDKVFMYLEKYINRRAVQNTLLEVFNETAYEYQKIFILKNLIKAKKISINLNEINKNNIYQSGNFLLIGYYFILIAKFGTSGQRISIKNDYEQKYSHEDKISRYFLIALKYFNNPAMINTLIRTKPVLRHTLNYINQKYEI